MSPATSEALALERSHGLDGLVPELLELPDGLM
jgi:hypothetical protein